MFRLLSMGRYSLFYVPGTYNEPRIPSFSGTRMVFSTLESHVVTKALRPTGSATAFAAETEPKRQASPVRATPREKERRGNNTWWASVCLANAREIAALAFSEAEYFVGSSLALRNTTLSSPRLPGSTTQPPQGTSLTCGLQGYHAQYRWGILAFIPVRGCPRGWARSAVHDTPTFFFHQIFNTKDPRNSENGLSSAISTFFLWGERLTHQPWPGSYDLRWTLKNLKRQSRPVVRRKEPSGGHCRPGIYQAKLWQTFIANRSG